MFLFFAFSAEYDRDVFETLYSSCKGLMLNKAYGILRDWHLAEDAVSEAFIRIYKNMAKIDDPTSNRSLAFVMTVLKNVALTMLEQRNRHAAEFIEEDLADGFNLEETVLSRLSEERVYILLNRVNREYREVFILKFAYEMSHKEIGRLLNITENNVTVRLHRAKKQIAAILREEGVYDRQQQ